jgi:hypothetical protein
MPPAVVAIGAIVATAAIQTFVTSVVLAAILTIAVNVAAYLLTRRPQGRTSSAAGQELRLKLDPTMPRQLCLGEAATGGSSVWAFTYGYDERSDQEIHNVYLVRVIALCDLPVQGIEVWSGKTKLVFDVDPTTAWAKCNNLFLRDSGGRLMWIRLYKGSDPAVADPNVMAWSGGQWTSAHKGTNMAYACVRYEFDNEGNAFPSGEPQLTFVLKGVKCYDDRKDGTKPGRSGSHRLDNPNSWEHTSNIAVLAAQSLRGFYSRGVLLFGAEADEEDLSDSMLISAYNTCDQLVAVGSGTQARYSGGMMVTSGEALANYLVELQTAFDGRIIDRGGAITLLPGAARTPVFDLTDEDVIWVANASWQPKSTLNELYNHVAGVFVDKESLFQEKGYPPLRNATWEQDDGGERFTYNVSFSAVNDWARVQRITKRIHLSSRYQGTIAFVLPLWGLEMEQGDWFTFVSEKWDFDLKYFECMNCDITSDGQIIVVGRETHPDIDGWDHVVDEVPRTDTYWNPPVVSFPVPTLESVIPFRDVNPANGTEVFGVEIIFYAVSVSSLAGSIQFQLAFTSDLANPWFAAEHPPVDDSRVKILGLLPNTSYSIRARSADGQAHSAWTDWVEFGTEGTTYNITYNLLSLVEIEADASGTPYTGELPFVYYPTVTQGSTDLRADPDVEYFILVGGCEANIVTADGPDKGKITITSTPTADGFIDLAVHYKGISQGSKRTTVKRVDALSVPTTPGGGGGVKSAVFAQPFASPTDNAIYSVLNGPVAILVDPTNWIHCTGTLTYNTTEFGGRRLRIKLQYSPTGMNTWTDFAGAITGSEAWPKEDLLVEAEGSFTPAVPGSLNAGQIGIPPAPGVYDVRLVGVHPDGPDIIRIRTSLLIEAK